MSNDIGEENNIASNHPDIVNELDNLLLEARSVSPISRFNFPQRGKNIIQWEKNNNEKDRNNK